MNTPARFFTKQQITDHKNHIYPNDELMRQLVNKGFKFGYYLQAKKKINNHYLRDDASLQNIFNMYMYHGFFEAVLTSH